MPFLRSCRDLLSAGPRSCEVRGRRASAAHRHTLIEEPHPLPYPVYDSLGDSCCTLGARPVAPGSWHLGL